RGGPRDARPGECRRRRARPRHHAHRGLPPRRAPGPPRARPGRGHGPHGGRRAGRAARCRHRCTADGHHAAARPGPPAPPPGRRPRPPRQRPGRRLRHGAPRREQGLGRRPRPRRHRRACGPRLRPRPHGRPVRPPRLVRRMTAPRAAWSLAGRLRGAVVVAGALLGVALVVAIVAFAQLARYQDNVTGRLFTAVIDLQDLQADLVDAEAAVRAFALSGDEELLAGYADLAYGRADDVRAVLTDAVPADAELHDHFDTLATAVDVWRIDHAEPVIAATRAGEEVADDWEATGTERYREMRAALQGTLDSLIDYRNETAGTMRDWQQTLLAAVLAVTVLGGASGVRLWRYLRRWVTGPLDARGQSGRAVAEGELDTPVVGGGPREIVVLADDVEQMRRRLVAEIARTEHARAELEASNRDLEQFAYVASHDLQEPLRKVASFTQLLERRYGDQLDDRGHQYIAFASDGARRMQRLIQDLLAFSRLGRVEEDPTPVVVADCLAEAVDNLSELVDETGAEVTAGPLPEV